MNKKALIFFVLFLMLILAGVILCNLDDSLAKRQYIIEGVFVSTSTFSASRSDAAGQAVRYFTFKLADGQMVSIEEPPLPMVQEKAYKLGDKAKIYYRKGFFTKRPMYDSFFFYQETK